MYRMYSQVIHLSLTTLLITSVGSSIDPYLRLISVDLVTFEQLALYFLAISFISLVQPILLGILADKVANVKGILIGCLIVATAFPTGLLWLPSRETVTDDMQIEFSPTSMVYFSWNGSNVQLRDTDAVDLSHPNMTLWLDIHTCHHGSDATVECVERLASLYNVLLHRDHPEQTFWNSQRQKSVASFKSCPPFNCSASIANATSTTVSLKWHGSYQYFLVLIFIRILSWMCWNATTSILDLTAKRELPTDGHQLQILSTGGNLLVPLMCGIIIDYVQRTRGNQGYFVAFVIGAVLAVLSVTLIVHLELSSWRTSVGWKATKMQCKLGIHLFLLVQLIGAWCWNFHWEFFVIYINSEMQATKTQIGIALCANGIGSIIVLGMGSSIILRLGPTYALALSLLINSFRLAVFYTVRSVWVLLILELFDGCARILPTMVNDHVKEADAPAWISNVDNPSSVVLGAGGILGASFGSFLIGMYGMRTTYLIFAFIAGTTALVYAFVSIFVKQCCPNESGVDESATELVDIHQLTRNSSDLPSNDEHEDAEEFDLGTTVVQ